LVKKAPYTHPLVSKGRVLCIAHAEELAAQVSSTYMLSKEDKIISQNKTVKF
jgi:hypothetical protein